MDSTVRFFQELWSSLRVADVLDIAVVSVLVYMLITWFQKARSRFVMTGLAALVALYFVARILKMYLTLLVLQAGVTVAAVALVVIFQEDIRRAFERIAVRGRLRGRRAAPLTASRATLDPVVEALSNLATRRIGALIVFKGSEPLERHLSGGFVLEGQISEPLLYSIFDPGSLGHDGAVVIDAGLVQKFGVHLPLSDAPGEDAPLGTRHTAALGMSEVSDAFVVAVSEERGTISVARHASIEVIGSAAELKHRLAAFLDEIAPERRVSPGRRLFTRKLGLKLLSIGVAIAAWALVFGYQGETVARTFSVPIAYRNVPSGWLLDEPRPIDARVTLSGSSRAFDVMHPSKLSIALDVGNVRPGTQRIALTESDLTHPTDLEVHRIDPATVIVVAHRMVAVMLRVAPKTAGRLSRGVSFQGVKVEPKRVKVLLKRADVGRIKSVATEPVDLTGIDRTTSSSRALILPDDARLAEGMPDKVDVTVEVTRSSGKP